MAGNSFGNLFKVSTFGESHGKAIGGVIDGKGRIFHSTLGHFDYSMECVGFITTLQRGAEWAATGKVTQEIPENFPTENTVQSIDWTK